MLWKMLCCVVMEDLFVGYALSPLFYHVLRTHGLLKTARGLFLYRMVVWCHGEYVRPGGWMVPLSQMGGT